jgi:hypothetical protein
MVERTFCVYKHTCSLCESTNGIYVGITCQEPEARWKTDGRGYLAKRKISNSTFVYAQPKMAAAILKYTWESFTHEILEIGLSYEEAKQKEIEYISFFNSYECGLNSTRGGDGLLVYLTEEDKRAAIKRNNRRYYQKIKTDPARFGKVKASNAVAMKKFLANPEHYAKELERTREKRRLENSTPEGRAKSAVQSRNRQHEVRDLRFRLRDLFLEHSELFSEEDKSCIFDFKPNDRKHYLCMSVTKLREILSRVELEIANEKRKNQN